MANWLNSYIDGWINYCLPGMAGSLTGWLDYWLAHWLALLAGFQRQSWNWLADTLAGWLAVSLRTGWHGWPPGWLAGWMAKNWLASCLARMVDWLDGIAG